MTDSMQNSGQPSQGVPPGQPQYQQPPMPGQYAPPYPQYPPPKKGMSGSKLAIILVCVAFGVLFLGGLLVGVLAVAVIPKLTDAKSKLEIKQMGDLEAGLEQIAPDSSKRRKLLGEGLHDSAGEELWVKLFQQRMIDQRLLKKVVSLNSRTDTPLNEHELESLTLPPQGHCSYTLPRGGKLLEVMSRKGANRCVLITLNSRNWKNYGQQGVPCIWSDGTGNGFMTFEQAQSEHGITAEEWADPAGKLFGKKAPFQFTYD
jgi:hypothetical protein